MSHVHFLIIVENLFFTVYFYGFRSNTTIPDWTFRLNETSMNVSSYNSNNSMVIILHGFQNSANDSLIHLIKHGKYFWHKYFTEKIVSRFICSYIIILK